VVREFFRWKLTEFAIVTETHASLPTARAWEGNYSR
jgi:hypothetical protein